MGVTRALRRNGIFQPWVAVEALADNAHGVSMMEKVAFVQFVKKGEDKKRSDVELWRESAYDSDGIELHTGLYVPGLRYMEKS